jgi:hypothetical protein
VSVECLTGQVASVATDVDRGAPSPGLPDPAAGGHRVGPDHISGDLGQGAFFFSTLFLPRKTGGRIVLGSLVVALGLGFYVIGGAVAPTPWTAVIFTFFACVNLSFLSGWNIGGPLALTLVMIYTAGLNTGSPEKASANFLVFAFVMGWSAIISLAPFWKPLPPPPVNENQAISDLSEQGFRMGIGTALALAISYNEAEIGQDPWHGTRGGSASTATN